MWLGGVTFVRRVPAGDVQEIIASTAEHLGNTNNHPTLSKEQHHPSKPFARKCIHLEMSNNPQMSI